MKYAKIFLLTSILYLLISCKAGINADNELLQVPALIQLSSTVSDGKYSIREIMSIARNDGIKVVMMTDRDFMNWEYGLWPLRRIVKKKVEANSISGYGIEKYFQEIENIQKENPDLILIAGVESAPFYYWEGLPFKNNFKIVDWHKHMLVFGLPKPEDYKNFPSVSNKNRLLLPLAIKDIYKLWPLLILVAGVLCLKKRKYNYKDSRGNHLGPYSRPWQIAGGTFFIVGLIFTINNYPFRKFEYCQYQGDQGAKPYQNFIDYVNEKGGLIFWAHPEIANTIKYGNVVAETKEYPELLSATRDYTGFTIFYEGDEKIGNIGGIWDETIMEYCRGIRNQPSWAIGGMGFDQTGNLDEAVKDLRTIFLVPQLNDKVIWEALRKGKMYVIRGKNCKNFVLDSFFVQDSLSDVKGITADEITLKGMPKINIKGHINNEKYSGKIIIKLIKNGAILKLFEVENFFEINYTDESLGRDKKNYYRLEISAADLILVTNPIFVKSP